MRKNILVPTAILDFDLLQSLTQKPPAFAPSDAPFWEDAYISQSMLAAHLDPHTDAASRRPETIEQSVAFLARQLALPAGSAVLDLGCGPGLYTQRLARLGYQVTGIDFSRNSLAYARAAAAREGLAVEYIQQNYLQLDLSEQFDAITLIYYDLGVFAPDQRADLLRRIARALKPGGFFVFDVVTGRQRPPAAHTASWRLEDNGFWRPGECLVLEQTFAYPEERAFLDQYLVVTADGSITPYHVWQQHFDVAAVDAMLAGCGLERAGLWSDLCGAPYSPETPALGIAARKPA
jgi:2-polyprenyl-3-methyl-5-hydroxy-6-metoxy-1,4-benzoquinol methylase